MKNYKSKSGFTLVELSIVLVIIGLLIGGILVAQSLIDSTKIQSFARQVGQFDAAVSSFVSKYEQLPGDNDLFGGTETLNALNDGTIQDLDGAIAEFDGEIGTFWYNLSQVGLMNDDGTDYTDRAANTTTAVVHGVAVPLAAAGTSAGFYPFGSGGLNWYWVSANGAANEDLGTLTDAFTPADALAIDLKIDDGDGDEGSLMADDSAGTITAPTGASAITSTGTTCITAAGGYVVTTDSEACQLVIRMGISHGDLQ